MAQTRSIRAIALEILDNWHNVCPYAMPYLDAMLWLDTIEDKYMFDSGRSIVLYFLSNASRWRGDVAKRIKAELKQLLK